jgi:hypothetical protein
LGIGQEQRATAQAFAREFDLPYPISTRVNSPRNDDPAILECQEMSGSAQTLDQ